MKKVRVLDAHYHIEEGKPIIVLLCRDEKKRKMIRVENFRPYFYCPIDATIPKHPAIDEVADCEKATFDGDKVKKVYVHVPMDVRSVRSFFPQTWEADILFGTRFMIDKGIREGIVMDEEKEVYDESEIGGY